MTTLLALLSNVIARTSGSPTPIDAANSAADPKLILLSLLSTVPTIALPMLLSQPS